MGQIWQRIVSPRDIKPLRSIGAAIFVRAAQLTGAACYGVLRHLYPNGEIPRQTIAVEGSVMEHVRGSLFMMEDTLRICQAGHYIQPMLAEPMLVKDGPSVGAAIAAAIKFGAASVCVPNHEASAYRRIRHCRLSSNNRQSLNRSDRWSRHRPAWSGD